MRITKPERLRRKSRALFFGLTHTEIRHAHNSTRRMAVLCVDSTPWPALNSCHNLLHPITRWLDYPIQLTRYTAFNVIRRKSISAPSREAEADRGAGTAELSSDIRVH